MTTTISTPLTDLFGVTHPIFVGGMMFLSDGRFVASAVNAGAMAFITTRSFPETDALRRELRLCNELTGGRPYGVNLTISSQASSNALLPDHLEIALSEGVRHFETAGQLPVALIERIHGAGGIVIHKASRVRHALAAERAGADAVGLVGMEEGGHPGANELTSSVLGAAAAPLLSVPFALGGGIGTGGQIVSALAIGAGAAIMGSRFVTADEIWAHEAYKRHIASLDHDCSTTALSSVGSTWRVLRNNTVREVQRLERAGMTSYAELGPLIKGTLARDHAYTAGDWETGMISLGSAAGFADRLEPTAQIVAQLIEEADAAIGRIRTLARGRSAATGRERIMASGPPTDRGMRS